MTARCLESLRIARAGLGGAASIAAHQRFLALRRGTVGEALWNDDPLAGALEGVVADRRRGAHPFLEIARLHRLALARRPESCIAIGLELHPHLERVGLSLGDAGLGAADALLDPGQRLDVMADLVGDDVGLGEIAG